MRGMHAVEQDQGIQNEPANRTMPPIKVRGIRKGIRKLFPKHRSAAFEASHPILPGNSSFSLTVQPVDLVQYPVTTLIFSFSWKILQSSQSPKGFMKPGKNLRMSAKTFTSRCI